MEQYPITRRRFVQDGMATAALAAGGLGALSAGAAAAAKGQ